MRGKSARRKGIQASARARDWVLSARRAVGRIVSGGNAVSSLLANIMRRSKGSESKNGNRV